MKPFLLFLVCILPLNLIAQENFSEQILHKIIEHKSSFNSLTKSTRIEKYVEDTITGELTAVVKKDSKKIQPMLSYYLLDTFNFFNNDLSIEKANLRIQIITNFKEHSREKNSNVYAIASYGTKEDLFWISIRHTHSNHLASYGFSIFGKEIKLQRFESGSY